MKAVRLSINIENINPINLFGLADENLRLISEHFDSMVVVRGDKIQISGPENEAEKVYNLFKNLIQLVKKGEIITQTHLRHEMNKMEQVQTNQKEATGQTRFTSYKMSGRHKMTNANKEPVDNAIQTPKKLIVPKSINQLNYLKAIDDYDIVITIGPAGTGKTYLAVAKAVQALLSGKISRIVLTRPAVEAGESLGFLPGNFKEKVDPYMRPFYDALYDMISVEKMKRLIDEQIIEIAPIAYMRGRTLSDSYIILDEAQNSTTIQMKMFLTRLGWNSKAIVTGDITQIDLAKSYSSGLVEIQEKLKHIKGIKFIYFDENDVVRPPLVSEIIKAYENK
ncbi:MAG: PhoH family protein [candidate division WOR-3 bacterium]